MACETKSKQIGESVWSVTQLPATAALELEARLFPALTQGIAPIMGAIGTSPDEQRRAVAEAFSAVSKAIPPTEYAKLIRDLCSMAARDGKPVNFEVDFSGGSGVFLKYQVAWFVLEANFADPLADLLPAGIAERVLEGMRSAGAPMASTGESGAPA